MKKTATFICLVAVIMLLLAMGTVVYLAINSSDSRINTVHSQNGQVSIYEASTKQQLADFLSTLDRSKYDVVDILADGKIPEEFYVIYAVKGIESSY